MLITPNPNPSSIYFTADKTPPAKEPKFAVFIGYDEREQAAYEVCKFTIEKYASGPVDVFPLDHRQLRAEGVFDRPWTVEGQTGRYVDQRDGRYFSTQFSHSRFLVPYLCRKQGYDYALFVDCDFVFRGDVYRLLTEVSNVPEVERKPVWVVKHDYKPTHRQKMDNQDQFNYNRKLWSSFMIFDVNHFLNDELTEEYVNFATGRNMHNFGWFGSLDSQIGMVGENWNFIPNHSEQRIPTDRIAAIHYTEGHPCMAQYKNCLYSSLYFTELQDYLQKKLLLN